MSEEQSNRAAESRTRECDLVMKGGITSGIVYPSLVLKLHDEYKFRCLGGTSAGAIAAAITAAAEYGGDEGFIKFAEVAEELGEENRILNLFHPSRKTRPLFNFSFDLVKIFKGSPVVKIKGGHKKIESSRTRVAIAPFRLTWNLLRRLPFTFIIGALVGIVLSLLVAYLTGGSLWGKGIVLAVIFGWIGALIGGLIRLTLILIYDVPDNFLGLCTGLSDQAHPGTALTDWLTEKIDSIAGVSEGPLTFGDLGKSGDRQDNQSKSDQGIMLRMVTSNLSQNQPYVLPFDDKLFLFKKGDFDQLFPPRVVDHLIKNAPSIKECKLVDSLAGEYYILPAGEDLPVVVATRMSLSFPLLLSAVPLYTIKPNKVPAALQKEETANIELEDLQLNWFSDGGICSNFPIHFFDAWLPVRPTFGVNLTSLPTSDFENNREHLKLESVTSTSPIANTEASKEQIDRQRDKVFLPRPDDILTTEYHSMGANGTSPGGAARQSIFRFIWNIFSTAQNFRDNSQSVLPSYRERIVQIRLEDDEGGLNLTMPDTKIKAVMALGGRAGEKLNDEFCFEHHQWIRLRVLMTQIEKRLGKMLEVLRNYPIYNEILGQRLNTKDYPFAMDDQLMGEIAKCLDDFVRLETSLRRAVTGNGGLPNNINSTGGSTELRILFGTSPAPLPEGSLRVTPDI